MMMGVGLLFMLVIALIVIGIPVLLATLIAGGGLATLFKPQNRQADSDHSLSVQKPTVDHKCPSCRRAVRTDWNICPSCGAALT